MPDRAAPPFGGVLPTLSLGYRIKALSQLITRSLQARLEPLGLTTLQAYLLLTLALDDGVATSVLGERLQAVGGTLTGVIDRLEKNGLLERRRDPHDRRVWRIWLTPAGRDLHSQLPPIIEQLHAEALQGVEAEQLHHFDALVGTVVRNLQAVAANSG